MTRLFAAVVLALVLMGASVGHAQTTTVTTATTTTVTTSTTTTTIHTTWSVISNNDCTALGAATGLTSAYVDCCLGAHQGNCEYRDTYGGTQFQRMVAFAASGTYSTGGDAPAATELAKVGLSTILFATCRPAVLANPATSGWVTTVRRTDALNAFKLQLFGAAVGSTGITEAASNTTVTNAVTHCLFVGH